MTGNSLILRRAALAAAASTLLGACGPLIVGGAMVGTTLVMTDRRTSGAQLEDQSIELKATTRVGEVLANRGRAGVTSYNRLVLITGEVPSDADKAGVEQAVQRVENVRAVVNELAVQAPTSLTSRSNDPVLTSMVKASFVDAKDLSANAFKVVTERGTVYLMGRVTEREANRASEIARSVSGVQKVVRVFEIITEAELAELTPKPAK
jgi:osmotically-inducible protein OsmY